MTGETTFTTVFLQRVHVDPIKIGPDGAWVSVRVSDNGLHPEGPGATAEISLALTVGDAHELALALYAATTALDTDVVPE